MLGFGLSSRPAFTTTPALPDSNTAPTLDNNVRGAEDFFVESLEAWRKAQKLDKMVLCGHSMGGYLSVAYSERYPSRVDRLVLLSPVGVPEFSQKEYDERMANISWKFKTLLSTLRGAWRMGLTPMSVLRSLPEKRGKALVDGYVHNRLKALESVEERNALADYFYNIGVMPGSGEYCLHSLLKPGAFAFKPLRHRIPKLEVEHVHFIYGQHDWMDLGGGMKVQEEVEELRKNGGKLPNIDVRVVMKAGHLLMLENSDETNSVLTNIISGKKDKVIRTEEMRRTEGGTYKYQQQEAGRGKAESNQV